MSDGESLNNPSKRSFGIKLVLGLASFVTFIKQSILLKMSEVFDEISNQ